MSKKQVTSGTKAKKTIVNIIIHIFLAILSFIWVLPIFWVVLTSFRGEKGSYVTTFFPKTYTINNYVKLFTDTSILNFPKMFVNTFIIAIFTCSTYHHRRDSLQSMFRTEPVYILHRNLQHLP